MNLLYIQLNKSLKESKRLLNPRNISLLIILDELCQQNGSDVDLQSNIAHYLSTQLLMTDE